MMLAAQLWAGYLSAHPMWLVAAGCAGLGTLVFLIPAAADMGEKPTTSPPAGHAAPPPAASGQVAGRAGPGPVEKDGYRSPGGTSPVHAPGPGTRKCPWEPAPPAPPVAAPTSKIWGPGVCHDQVTAAIGSQP